MVSTSTPLSRREPSAIWSDVLQPFHLYGVAYSFGGLAESHLILSLSLHSREGYSFLDLVPPDDAVNCESVVEVQASGSGVVIGYQIDEFAHIWFTEQFVAYSHIYPGFMGKMSSLNHFPLELGCEDYSFLGQEIAYFEQGLVSILTDSIETLELDTSFD